jgi:glycosyltransferase involved in cell wall biosynthesis
MGGVSVELERARVALVHDWLNQLGGAENVLEELVALFPRAPIYTSMYAPRQMPDAYRRWSIHTSFMQWLPGVATHHQAYLPLYPLAFNRMDLSGYDLVLSNKSGFCHGVQVRNGQSHGQAHPTLNQPRALHVCYCLTPTRFLWLYDHYREREQIGGALHAVLQPVLRLLRRWDWRAAQRIDHFIAISRTVQKRIETIYGRESVVIHPPVDTTYFAPKPVTPGTLSQKEDEYYLIVSRLIPYKRIDLAINAFNRLPDHKLLIVGDGRDRAALTAQAGPNIHFLGRQPREKIRELLRGCQAFLFPGLEDFGIAPVEAMSVGRPVIAYGGGGALDTILPGVTGELFAQQNAESLYETLACFDPTAYDPAACRTQAEQFSVAQFRHKLLAFLQHVLTD